MKKARKITLTVTPESTTDGAGVLLKRVLGTHKLSYVDPFLMLDHFGSEYPDDYIAGFPMHPHRGIETVTYVLYGGIKHRDSEGNEGIIRQGGVQWMTAGSGIIHEEMPQLEDGKLEGFQLWVNLPSRSKMMRPRYREFGKDDIPLSESEGVTVRVIAGSYGNVNGAIMDLEAASGMLDVELEPRAVFEYALSDRHNAFLYVFRGECSTEGGQTVAAPLLAVLEDGDGITVRASDKGARFLLVHGEPLREPVARYGPFVMNTREEIAAALQELNSGVFVK